MRSLGLAALTLAAAAGGAAVAPAQTGAVVAKGPAEMVALADADPRRSHTGRYQMVVAAASRNPNVLYLNSEADYKTAGDVTFRLSPAVAKRLDKELGAAAETALVGKSIVVQGVLERTAIVNTVNQRAQSFNRWFYAVAVNQRAQIVAISAP